MREPQNDGSASFIGSSSGIHFIRHVYNAFARRSADLQQTRARDRGFVPGEDDRLHRGSGSNRDADELWSRNELSFASHLTFSFEDLVIWTRLYFENWHPIFPCLHAPRVLKAMETLAQKGMDSISKTDLVIIRSLLSISLGDRRQAPKSGMKPVPANLVFQTVQDVMGDVQSLLIEPTTLPLLQAAFVAQLTLASLLRLNAASRVGGVITRTAFHLGLHRCPGRFTCFSAEETDIRRRVFWSIYSLERYLSQALGIPLSIRDDDIDVCYPGAERHVTATKANASDDQRLRLLCHLAKFSRIRGLILELRNKSILHSHAGAVEASHVNGELSQWWNEVYDDVNPIDDQEEAGLTPYHRLLLMILRHEAIISMNRPLLAAEKPSAEYKNALQTCIASSRSLLAALKKYLSSPSNAPLTWPSFTWTTWMACLILMFASWEGEFPVPTALKYARIGVSTLEHLALRGSSWPETCLEAIRSMESALMTSASSDGQSSQGALADGDPAHNHKSGARDNASGIQPQHRDYQLAGSSVPVAPSHAEEDHSSVRTRNLERPASSATRVDPGVPYDDTTIISSHVPQGNEVEMPSNDNFFPNGQTSGGLIFGNMATGNGPFYPGIAGQDPFSFSDPLSLAMPDLWSVADGPWMIDGNLL